MLLNETNRFADRSPVALVAMDRLHTESHLGFDQATDLLDWIDNQHYRVVSVRLDAAGQMEVVWAES